MSEWISVEDRLPTDYGVYKCKVTIGGMSPKKLEKRKLFMETGIPRFLKGDWETVTHWKENDCE